MPPVPDMWTTVAAAVGPSYAGDVADQLVVGFDLDMTLIDTVGGFAATLEVLGAELGIDVPDRDHDLPARTPAGPPAARPHAGGPGRRRPPTGSGSSTPTTRSRRRRRSPARTRRSLPYDGARGGSLLVTGKYTRNAQLHVDHLGLDVDHLAGEVWGAGKGDVLREHGRERLRRRPRARRRGSARGRGHQRLRADRRVHRGRAPRGRDARRAPGPDASSPPGWTATSWRPGWPRSRPSCVGTAALMVAF